jgi:hypothetical protein
LEQPKDKKTPTFSHYNNKPTFPSLNSLSNPKYICTLFLFCRERARKASRELYREKNDTSGGGKVKKTSQIVIKHELPFGINLLQ